MRGIYALSYYYMISCYQMPGTTSRKEKDSLQYGKQWRDNFKFRQQLRKSINVHIFPFVQMRPPLETRDAQSNSCFEQLIKKFCIPLVTVHIEEVCLSPYSEILLSLHNFKPA